MQQNKKSFITGIAIGIAIAIIAVFGISTFGNIDLSDKKAIYLKHLIDKYYTGEIDKQAMDSGAKEGTYKGLIAALGDPYTEYYTAEEYSKLLEDSKGVFYGIGVTVTANKSDNSILVLNVIEKGPAEKAGLLAGDKIIAVDDNDVTGDKMDEAVRMMKGDEGTNVKVTVYRESDSKSIDFTITRGVVENVTVKYEMLQNEIGYIKLSAFEGVSYNQFKNAYDSLNEAGQRGLIIDLRYNTGGQLKTAEDIADLLIPEGPIVSIEEKGKEKRVDRVSDANKIEIPLVMLVNEYSASASEVLTGAVKDYGVGKVVGTKTFGKGIVQTIMSVGDGSGIKITTAKYYTPSGVCIHEIGIEPDYVIDFPDELKNKLIITRDEDVQLNKAIEVISQQL